MLLQGYIAIADNGRGTNANDLQKWASIGGQPAGVPTGKCNGKKLMKRASCIELLVIECECECFDSESADAHAIP